MSNPGVSPVDPTSPVGQVRLTIGDTQAAPLDPPVDGQASYEWFSDTELRQHLLAANGSVLRATGFAIMQLATGFALTDGRPVKTDDLSIGASTRGTTLMSIAQSFFSQANDEEATAESIGFLIVSPTPYGRSPEGTPSPLSVFA